MLICQQLLRDLKQETSSFVGIKVFMSSWNFVLSWIEHEKSFITWIKRAYQIINFLFLNKNICCGYSKEPSQWDSSFEHPKHMLKMMGKKLFAYYCMLKYFIYLNLWNTLNSGQEQSDKSPQ